MQRRIAACVVAAVFAVACSQSPKSRTTASSSVASPTTVTSDQGVSCGLNPWKTTMAPGANPGPYVQGSRGV